MFPSKSWEGYEESLRASGQRRIVDPVSNAFLVDIGMMDATGALTPLGSSYYQALFVRRSAADADLFVREALQASRPVQAILQHQFGVAGANKESAEALLRFHELDAGLTARSLGALLTLMGRFNLIRYYRGDIHVLESPAEDQGVPSSMFIGRQTPFGNKVWLQRALSDLNGHVYWLDKNFIPAGLEPIWEIADANKIDRVRILSIAMPASTGKKARTKYLDLKAELANRGIDLEWRFIDSKLIRDTHDRWIIGDATAWNVPDVNTILSGNHSEIGRSASSEKLAGLFNDYWVQGVVMDQYVPIVAVETPALEAA